MMKEGKKGGNSIETLKEAMFLIKSNKNKLIIIFLILIFYQFYKSKSKYIYFFKIRAKWAQNECEKKNREYGFYGFN